MAWRVPDSALVLIDKKKYPAYYFYSKVISFIYHSMLAKHQGKVGRHLQPNKEMVRNNMIIITITIFILIITYYSSL